MDLGLKGKNVLITGSSKGIGLATAKAFLQEGATVVLNARNKERLNQVISDLRNLHPRRVFGFAGDITKSEDAATVVRLLNESFDTLDIFVANLGSGKPEHSNPLDIAEWHRFMDINVFGNLSIIDQLHPLLKKTKNSNVVFLSSIVAKQRATAPVGYAAAKSSVLALTKYLANSWAQDGIRVNCVVPGNVYFEGGRWEELLHSDNDGVKNYIESEVPLKRFGKPEEIADAILFLASERASFITGSSLVVDGGQLTAI